MDVLIDYLTASVKTRGVDELMDYMRIDIYECTHKHSCFSRFGMVGCYWFNGIKLHYGTYCILDLSGAGCRTLETLLGDEFDWQQFILWLLVGDGHISRIDIALDDNNDDDPKLEMCRMIQHAFEHRYISKAQYVTYEGGSKEEVQAGSPASDKLLRIYNKAMERGYGPERHWIRCELQLRNEKANQFWMHWFFEQIPIGQVFAGTVLEFFRFTDEYYNGNHASRLTVCSWWLAFLEDAKRLKDVLIGGLVYNELAVDTYLRKQAASTIKTYLGLSGGDLTPLLELVEAAKLNDKQRVLLYDKMNREEILKQVAEASKEYVQIRIGDAEDE